MFVGATPAVMSNNTLTLEIYFSTLQYVDVVSVAAYSLMALLSDVGGALSLLLGATLLTVYELLEFSVQLGHHVTVTRRRPTLNYIANTTQ